MNRHGPAAPGPARPYRNGRVRRERRDRKGLRPLAARDRMILVLHHVEERPVAEIARSLGIPVGTAKKWRLHAARGALEKAMEAEA